MARFQKTVPKHPLDSDATLKAVLDNIKFQNENDAKLVDSSIDANEAILRTKTDATGSPRKSTWYSSGR